MAEKFDLSLFESYREDTIEEDFGGENPDKTVVTLPLVEKEHFSHNTEKCAKKGAKAEAIQERMERIYQEIRKNPAVKNIELEILVGASKRQVEYAIKALQAEKMIYKKGGNRKGKWIINE